MDIFYILFGSGIVYCGMLIAIKIFRVTFNEMLGKQEKELGKPIYIIIGIISTILFSVYDLVEVKEIYQPHPLNTITYDGPISNMFNILAIFVIVFFISNITISFIKYFVTKEEMQNDYRIYIISILLSFGAIYCYYAGAKEIDSYFARDRFITKCIVNAFPDESKDKNYRLEADIRVDNGSIFSYGDKEVYILKIYFENGGYLEPDYQDNYYFKDDRTIMIEDQDGEQWYIEIPKQ